MLQPWLKPALALSAQGKVVVRSPSKETWLLFSPQTKRQGGLRPSAATAIEDPAA
jgi:hypothetical protein